MRPSTRLVVLAIVSSLTLPQAFAANPSPKAAKSSPETESLADVVERISPGVVNISSTTVVHTRVYGMDEYLRLWGFPQERKQTSLGSGFILDQDGFLITNNHVVEHADEVEINLWDKKQYRAKIIGTDQKMDIALLQIQDKNGRVPPGLKPVPLGDSDSVRVAETVIAVGNPFGLEHTVTRGIISAKKRTFGFGPFDNFLQTDASINPGNSGGPLFNAKGEVIGINTAIRSETGSNIGLGFATPINVAKTLIPYLKRYGRVPRPWLGIRGERVTPQLQQYYGLATSKGVLVFNIVETGPADQFGLQQGDILIEIDQGSVAEPNDVERLLAKYKPKDQVTLKFYRGNKTRQLSITLEELPRLDDIPKGIL